MLDIYTSLKKKITTDKTTITIGDICEVKAGSPFNIDEITRLTILKRASNSNERFIVVSIMDIIAAINLKHKNITINNLGEVNTVVEFLEQPENVFFKWAKVIFISLIIVTGCATAIIAFHVDSQLSKIFEIYGTILGIVEIDRIFVLEVPYSLGIALGIIVFFNHFAGKKISKDPTPIEVEMTTYEDDVLTTVIDNSMENKK